MSEAKKRPRRRKVEVVVVSDVHLGTYGCHAAELLRYLKSVRPAVLVLNGDIVDIWQFSKSYWPAAHMRVVRYLAGLAAKGTKIHYLTGNHDELLRKFAGTRLGNFRIDNKLVLELPEGKAWLFHGDVFDVTMQHSRWLARLGAHGYDLLILINRVVNFLLQKLGRPRVALSKAVKNRVKGAVNLISGFEQTAARIAVDNGYRYVACGHIHHPEIKTVTTPEGEVVYLNSGDWVENLTALEYSAATGWQLYRYADDPRMQQPAETETDAGDQAADMPVADLLSGLLVEFKLNTPA
ncbi:UDP-2,3-diacylglucosamine pyrophosphatase LpxH [Hymenobacter daecheongensis DSM 21074]|uniref:UDP-2,3-diacylglucosamine pyrophosphatase LpxH n=1 Tax=Hymenobacter daecheongensis DSM 21074 TaxID=1121955 RepID=A0A1M6HS92_9BACT|nr:UDP-2,3-diacylglucosamine diphosphatase [Hymenobacter daecheongensis]SHJ25070.1 UDP-2,3-diacylglucosamine pyrophosphatase LpxH [Hymenobacter daecheongensis DSM 21074]